MMKVGVEATRDPSVRRPDDPFDLVGDVLDGQYRVDAVAGEGDLSVVYKGRHLGVDADVAIKCLNLPQTLDPALVRPLLEDFREASRVHYRLATGSLHIAQSLGSGQTIAPRTGATVPYLVREWYEGESLAADLAQRRREGEKGRSIEEAMALLEPAIEAIAYAHEQGTPHLAVSPSNLFVASKDGGRSVKVLDFGVARAMNELAAIPADAQATRGLRVLFPAYAAPEQLDKAAGAVGPWTDVYALALIVMELLSDRIVMHGSETGALVDRTLHATKRPTPAAHGLHLTRNLELVLTRAVAREPSRRQKDAGVLGRDLKSALRGTAMRSVRAPATIPSSPPPATLGSRQAPTLMGIAPAGALVRAAPRQASMPPVPSGGTLPMSFEPSPPMSVADPTPAPERAPALASDEAPAGDEAPPAGRTITAKLPPPSPVPALHIDRLPPPFWSALQHRAPSRAAALALVAGGSLVMSVLGGALLLLAVGSFRTTASAAPLASAAALGAAATHAAPALSNSAPPSSAAISPARMASGAAPFTARFSASAAKRAFDGASRDVAGCKRGARWGVANATVTFDPDGSVKQVIIGPPFAGTPTGRCVGDFLGAVHVPAFSGEPAVYVTQFYVAPR